MSNTEPMVFVIDDDQGVRKSLSFLLSTVGLQVQAFDSADEFLDSLETLQACEQGCIVTDVRMPGMSGMDLQKELVKRNVVLPVIMMTGHGDVPMAVDALKSGAFEFLQKPFNKQTMINAIHKAIQISVKANQDNEAKRAAEQRYALLTRREREVLELILSSKSNKIMAHSLGVSDRTIEAHRGKIMKKMEVSSVVELTQILMMLKSSRKGP